MKKIKKLMQIIKYNLSTLISFELSFKVITVLFITPLFLKISNLLIKLTGYNYFEFRFLLNPLFILVLLILLLLSIFLTIFDITTIIIIFDMSSKSKKISVLDSIKLSISKCKNIFKIRNIDLFILSIFFNIIFSILVFLNFISISNILNYTNNLTINSKLLILLCLIVLIFISFTLFKFIYSYHYLVLENISFKQAVKKSINLNKNYYIKDSLKLFIIQILMFIVFFILILLNILIIRIDKIPNIIILILPILSIIIIYTFFNIITFSSISTLYYSHKLEIKEKKATITLKTIKNKYKHLKIVIIFIILITLIFNIIFAIEYCLGRYNITNYYTKLECFSPALITGHRGASKNYPENTMSAFIKAKELGADWIELDVQQTSDGKIIVIHDLNFGRTTGVYKNTWKMTYEEVKKLNAGKYLGFKYERIPLFEDVIKWAKKNNIKLNIELKPNMFQTNLEIKVIDIIKKLNYQDNCVVTSQVYNSIAKVKEYDNDIETVFVTGKIYGDVESLTAADHFSINEYFITPDLVTKIHNMGKQIYAWTIDDPVHMKRMLDLNVDNIITNDITLAKNIIYLNRKIKAVKVSDTRNMINDYIKSVKKYFRYN